MGNPAEERKIRRKKVKSLGERGVRWRAHMRGDSAVLRRGVNFNGVTAETTGVRSTSGGGAAAGEWEKRKPSRGHCGIKKGKNRWEG